MTVTAEDGTQKTYTVTVNRASGTVNPTLYSLTVVNGTGSGSFEAGTQVSIMANAAPQGEEFDKWTGDISGIDNVNAANTTLTMPASAITITATYRIIVANGNIETSALKAWTQNGILYINGLTPGEPWSVYNLTGSLIYTGIATDSETTLTLPGRGIYILKNSNFVAKIIN